MYKEVAIDIVARYVEEAVNGAKGNIVSVSVRQIGKWYERKFGRLMPRRTVFYIVRILRVLYALGVLQKIGNKFVFGKDSQMWKCVKEGRTRECITEHVANYTKLVEAT